MASPDKLQKRFMPSRGFSFKSDVLKFSQLKLDLSFSCGSAYLQQCANRAIGHKQHTRLISNTQNCYYTLLPEAATHTL